jgi:membrane protease YdiL (CAAX protease family)
MTEVVVPAGSVVAALMVIALVIRHRAGLAGRAQRAALAGVPGLDRRSWLVRWLQSISIDQWRAIDAETARDPGEAGATSASVLAILVTVAASLAMQEYFGSPEVYARLFPLDGGSSWELQGFIWWSGWRVAGYVLVPVLVLVCLPGQRIADYHISLRNFGKHLWIYAVLFALVSPAVLIASTSESFRQLYPFYRMANRSYADLAIWEVLYAAQFLALEFFFRGFILQGLRRALGANAIFVMLIPYCMIHFGKPFPETIGAIGAGLILGTLAMRTRSIWGGVVIHVGVAISMDLLALRGCPPFGGAPCH